MHSPRVPIRRALWATTLFLTVLGSRAAAQDPADAARRAAAAVLRPGDRIELQFRRHRELNASINVNERGEAVFPSLGTLDVSRISIAELPDTLTVRYTEFLRRPELEVVVLRRVVVNGEVRMPNVHMLDVASGVREAIARSGGFLETANRKDIVIVRDGRRIPVADWERAGGAETDLQSGDQIVVGRKSWFALNALPLVSTSVIVIGLIQSLRTR